MRARTQRRRVVLALAAKLRARDGNAVRSESLVRCTSCYRVLVNASHAVRNEVDGVGCLLVLADQGVRFLLDFFQLLIYQQLEIIFRKVVMKEVASVIASGGVRKHVRAVQTLVEQDVLVLFKFSLADLRGFVQSFDLFLDARQQ